MSRSRPLAAVAVTLLLACVFATPAGAQTSTLDGETLVALFSKCNDDPGPPPPPPDSACALNPAPPTVQATCDENGTSTLAYDITATSAPQQGSVQIQPSAAAGPYPGTFREDGTVTIAPQTGSVVPIDPSGPFGGILTGSSGFNSGPLLTWSARFEINSGDTTIVGRKTLSATLPGFGVCAELQNEPGPSPLPSVPLNGFAFIGDATLDYTATISSPGGVYRDHGTAESDLRDIFFTYLNQHQTGVTTDVGADVGLLVEIFDSALTAPEPASADSCKKGGFANFGGLDFLNQGDCVSYFATNGSNEPGRNVP